MFKHVPSHFETDIYLRNAKMNIKNVKHTIADLNFQSDKVVICGRGSGDHPDFRPRFSTPTTNIDSEIYVVVDHSPHYTRFINKTGNYALSLIVNPELPKKILSEGGKIYWFSTEYLEDDIPRIRFERNSGIAAISLANYFHVKYVLLSGMTLDGQYAEFFEGGRSVIMEVESRGTKVFTIHGNLTKKITFNEWCQL